MKEGDNESRIEQASGEILLEAVLYRFRYVLREAFMHDDSSLFLFLFDKETGNILAVSTSFLKHTGWNFRDMEGHPFIDFVHQDDKQATLNAFSRAQGNNEELAKNDGFVNRYMCKDDTFQYIHWKGSVPVLDLWFIVAFPSDLKEYERAKADFPKDW